MIPELKTNASKVSRTFITSPHPVVQIIPWPCKYTEGVRNQ